jgi:ABC-type bacteriocin/lantibiotic exporter with double-glycine peptidase domain
MPTALYSMNLPDPEESRKMVNTMCLCMVALAIWAGTCGTLGKSFFAITGENITINIRMKLYKVILRKNMGWHDRRENSTGILTGVLSRDIGFLNAVSTE